MRGLSVGKHYLSAVLLLATGCWTTEPEVKPPPHPDEYVAPPEDQRFCVPPVFPKEAQREFKRNSDSSGGLDQPGKTGPRFGAGPGMGG